MTGPRICQNWGNGTVIGAQERRVGDLCSGIGEDEPAFDRLAAGELRLAVAVAVQHAERDHRREEDLAARVQIAAVEAELSRRRRRVAQGDVRVDEALAVPGVIVDVPHRERIRAVGDLGDRQLPPVPLAMNRNVHDHASTGRGAKHQCRQYKRQIAIEGCPCRGGSGLSVEAQRWALQPGRRQASGLAGASRAAGRSRRSTGPRALVSDRRSREPAGDPRTEHARDRAVGRAAAGA